MEDKDGGSGKNLSKAKKGLSYRSAFFDGVRRLKQHQGYLRHRDHVI